MDAFFVPNHEFVHPYTVKLWTTSTFDGTSYLMTFDGVKFRLYNFLTKRLLKECDFLNREALSLICPIYSPTFPNKAIFLMIKNRRNIIAYDDLLSNVPSLALDTKIIVLAMAWSVKQTTLFLAGNFGWIRALRVHIQTSLSGTAAEWEPLWSHHKSGEWVQQLSVDETSGYLFGASGTDVYIFSMKDGSVLQKFSTNQTMDISSICYSQEHLMFFTASSDGSIKTWQLFEKSSLNIQTIEQPKLGPIRMQIDEKSFLTVSHERVLRRYNMITGNVIGEYNLEPSVPHDKKNIEVTLQLQVAFTNDDERREWLFESEGDKISMFQVCYAPKELSICSDIVVQISIHPSGKIYALSKNNIIHQLYADTHETVVFDLDTMPVLNTGRPHAISVPTSAMVLHDCMLYASFTSGEIKALNLDTKEYFEMNEPDIGNPITSMLPQEDVLTARHSYCTHCSHAKSLLISSSADGGIIIHCPMCRNYIGSWKVTKTGMLKMERIPGTQYVIGIEETVVHIFRVSEEEFASVFEMKLDEFEYAQSFAFATDRLVVIALDNGKGKIYEYVPVPKPHLQPRHIMKLHESGFTKIVSTRDLRAFQGGAAAISEFDLEGFVVSIGVNDTLTIADTNTGIVQYTADIPKHMASHNLALLYAHKIMLVLSVDQNIRLLDWPEFQRILPSPPSSPKESPKQEIITHEEEEEEEDIVIPFNFFANQTTTNFRSSILLSASHSELSDVNSEESFLTLTMPPQPQKPLVYPYVPPEERKSVDLVFDHGWPRIVVVGEDEVIMPDSSSVSLGSLLDPQDQSKLDDAMEHNRNIIKKMIENDPYVAKAFKTRKVKKIRSVEAPEFDEDIFNEFFLTLSVKSISKETFRDAFARRSRFPTPKSSASQTSLQSFSQREQPEQIYETGYIRPIGRRKKRSSHKRVIVIELDDNSTIVCNELTADILKQREKLEKKKERYRKYKKQKDRQYFAFSGFDDARIAELDRLLHRPGSAEDEYAPENEIKTPLEPSSSREQLFNRPPLLPENEGEYEEEDENKEQNEKNRELFERIKAIREQRRRLEEEEEEAEEAEEASGENEEEEDTSHLVKETPNKTPSPAPKLNPRRPPAGPGKDKKKTDKEADQEKPQKLRRDNSNRTSMKELMGGGSKINARDLQHYLEVDASGIKKGFQPVMKGGRKLGRKTQSTKNSPELTDEEQEEVVPYVPPSKEKEKQRKKTQIHVKKKAKESTKEEKPSGPSRSELLKKEEEELLAKLMENTVDLGVGGSINIKAAPVASNIKKALKPEKKEITTLADPLDDKLLNNIASLNLMNQKADDTPERRIIRCASSEFALERKQTFHRAKLRMLKEYEMREAVNAFFSYDAPSLFDDKTGKLRRNSF